MERGLWVARAVSLQSANGRGGAEKAHGDVDAVVVAGRLVPNSELLMEAGMGVELPSRQPQRKHRLAAQLESAPPGWFVAGNVVGSVLPAQWCRFHGAWVGRAAARHVLAARAD